MQKMSSKILRTIFFAIKKNKANRKTDVKKIKRKIVNKINHIIYRNGIKNKNLKKYIISTKTTINFKIKKSQKYKTP